MVQFPFTFEPSAPVEHGGASYAQLAFTRPVNFVDVIAAEGIEDSILRMSTVYASLAGVPVGVVLALSTEDQLRLAETVLPILALPPAIEG